MQSNTSRFGVDPGGAFSPATADDRMRRRLLSPLAKVLGLLAFCAGFVWGLAQLGGGR